MSGPSAATCAGAGCGAGWRGQRGRVGVEQRRLHPHRARHVSGLQSLDAEVQRDRGRRDLTVDPVPPRPPTVSGGQRALPQLGGASRAVRCGHASADRTVPVAPVMREQHRSRRERHVAAQRQRKRHGRVRPASQRRARRPHRGGRAIASPRTRRQDAVAAPKAATALPRPRRPRDSACVIALELDRLLISPASVTPGLARAPANRRRRSSGRSVCSPHSWIDVICEPLPGAPTAACNSPLRP